MAPTATVLDATLVDLVMAGTAEKLLEMGITSPVFASANTDESDRANRAVIAEYHKRIRFL